ncbi:hypothetical protein KKE45_01515, partial [Patescibacteria group bacterium]|nr:hypothetical protein [Patescibacteria group bacterium]
MKKVFLIGMIGVLGMFVTIKKAKAIVDEVPIFVESEIVEPTVFVREERLNITEPKDERSIDHLEMVLERQKVG